MNLSEQKKRFYAGVYPSRPYEWEVDEIFERLSDLDEVSREALLSHVGAIWPVSHSLCFDYLNNGVNALPMLSGELLPLWVKQILGLYESKGLLGARKFMADVDKFFLAPMRGEAGVAFEELSARMIHYLRGISGQSFELGVATVPATDTKTIFLPGYLDIFPNKEKNILLYKLLVTLQWGNIDSRIFVDNLWPNNGAQDIFFSYPDRQLAVDLFSILQFAGVFSKLTSELPGLVRKGRDLCASLIEDVDHGEGVLDRCNALRSMLDGIIRCDGSPRLFAHSFAKAGEDPDYDLHYDRIVSQLPGLYNRISKLPGSYVLGNTSLLLGEFDFPRAGEVIRLEREKDKNKFVTMLAAIIEQKSNHANEESGGGNIPDNFEETFLLILKEHKGKQSRGEKSKIQIDNEGIELPEELSALISKIEQDLGALPEAYVQAAAGQGGGAINRQENSDSVEMPQLNSTAVHSYDEWDYRRGGYRADWCSLYEKSLNPVRSGFVASTLVKYRVQLFKLRRQFEMLRTRHRFIKRRRHGDDIDLDALIEALGDSRAGLTPSDRLFVRLLRDERDITTLFLVDMSNSTQGWVGVAIKEALVLLAEALEVVGDQYGIYGFSGMRRSKSELYHIKHLEESYGEEVQRRIGAIAPREYTRMGPPIRHLTKMLQATQSKIRLLLVISDGKPEDYDDYKGQYAIEDTRKALLEARGKGVYPFCITIDKSAHEYLAHMFGRGNYVFVDNVPSLPEKMAEMYRLLTS